MAQLCKGNERALLGCTYDSSWQNQRKVRHVWHCQKLVSTLCAVIAFLSVDSSLFAATAPSTYSAYSGTDAKPVPRAPALGPVNSVIKDPTFGSRILRVTDARSHGGNSLIPEYAGNFRTWNANSTALKLHGPWGSSYWLEFNPSTFKVGDGSSRPTLHPLSFDVKWEWSAVDPNIIYFINGTQLAKYNKSTNVVTNLGGRGVSLRYHVMVVGLDAWVCAAGPGTQNTYRQIFCVNPRNPSQTKFIDILKRTINGVYQSDPNWPTSAPYKTIGIHAMCGSATGTWLEVGFHYASWGAGGDSVFNLSTNKWSLLKPSRHSSGHSSIGTKFVNGSGSINGSYSQGASLRNPSNLMDSTQVKFIMQPPSSAATGWYDGEHSSWFNSSTNPNAPVLFSRYDISRPPSPRVWYGEIIAAATDGSNRVWRFAHNHNGGLVNWIGGAFAQISNDGRWALFSSPWDGTLGGAAGDFGYPTRLDTFIVELR